MDKPIIISIIISGLLIGGALWFVSGKSGEGINAGDTASVSAAGGKQIIDVSAKGGYSPRLISAKAGLPTTLRVKTNGTFDCSASLVIPKLSYQKFLQPSGIEEIAITPEQARGTMRGLCSMGMYNFQIRFQ
ncbi:MAG: cupredoxin domain-containing protein [Candidatus Harrisonbacteria bacterium]|nr:cupredoxin domain-containing protein [Candidatus Harrisonbacteria bacterium]